MSYNTWLMQHGRKRANPLGHKFIHFPAKCRCPYPYCKRCGILALKNDETRKYIKRGCAADYLAPDETEDGIIL